MRNKFDKRFLFGIGIVAAFILLVAALVFSYYAPPSNAPGWFDFLFAHHVEFMLFIAFSGILVGAIIANLAMGKAEEKTVEAKINAQMLLSFLSEDERKTVAYLLESDGKTYQNEISRLPGMTRLKAHRTVIRLAAKNIISVESHGKANRLKLAPQILDALKNSN